MTIPNQSFLSVFLSLPLMTRKMTNPVTGLEVEILVTTGESQGKLFKIQSTMKARQLNKSPFHFHGTFSENLTVVEGQLNLIVSRNKKELVLHAGESYLVEPGCPHTIWNDSDAPVTYTVEVEPAQHFEQTLKINHALAAAGKASRGGTPSNLLHIALLGQMGSTYQYGISLVVQKAAFFALAGIARLLGVDRKLQALIR